MKRILTVVLALLWFCQPCVAQASSAEAAALRAAHVAYFGGFPNDRAAVLALGSSYWEGRGVPQDTEQATFWFRKAADQGHAISQFNLGIAYESGIGVPEDTRQASVWYHRAAAQGHSSAKARLATRTSGGTGDRPNDDASTGFFRSLIGATVGATMMAAAGADSEQVLGGALKAAQIFNPDSAATASLGAAGDTLLNGSSASPMAGAGLPQGGAGYPARSNLASGACQGFTEANFQERALSGGGDQQLYAMCGQAFEYYTMYKRAIAQGYSEADANRTYAAHEQAARVVKGYLQSHGAN